MKKLIVTYLLMISGALYCETQSQITGRSPSATYHELALEIGLIDESTGIVKCGFPVAAYAFEHQSAMQARLLTDRPAAQKNVLRGNFRIHYDTSGINTPAMLDAFYQRIAGSHEEFVDSVAAIMNHVFAVETGVVGYPAAPNDGGLGGGPEYDIYIQELGFLYGSTNFDNTPIAPRRYTTFMEIDNDFVFVIPDSNKGLPGLRVTLAHEYHHAIQIGNYGYWGGDNIFYYEMTSVWMEDVVFTEVNDYYNYLRSSQGHFRHPDISFTSNAFIAYSRGIWCQFIEKRFGPVAMKRSWELILNDPPLVSIDQALQETPYSSSFRNAFAEWTLWNYFTASRADTSQYYVEGAFYPLITQRVAGFFGNSGSLVDSTESLAARYHQVLYQADTLTLALSNLNTEAANAGDPGPFGYTFLLNKVRVDNSYILTDAGFYLKLDVPDPSNWYNWEIFNGGVRPASIKNGVAFPNPFINNGLNSVRIPIASTAPVIGTLSVFATSMDEVLTRTSSSVLFLGKNVFVWNGRNNNNQIVQSGIYFFVLELPEETMTGKIAVLRE